MSDEWDNIPVAVLITEDKTQYLKADDVIYFLKRVYKDVDKQEKEIVHRILMSFIKCKNMKL